MAERSLRCVAIAYRSYDSDKVPTAEEGLDNWALPEDELVLLAIVGIKVCFWSFCPSICLSLSLSYEF